MAVQEKLYTTDEFWEFSRQVENQEKRLELIKGIIHEMAPSSPTNTIIGIRVARLLANYVEERDLGYVTGADGGFTLGPGDVRLPDTAFISKARLPEIPEKEFLIAPDLAVEVISPSERPRQVLDKVGAYLRAGTRLVWAIYPDDEVIDVCTLSSDGGIHVQTMNMDDELNGGEALPGLRIKVRDVFKKPSA